MNARRLIIRSPYRQWRAASAARRDVLRLMASSYLVDRMTGRSAGFKRQTGANSMPAVAHAAAETFAVADATNLSGLVRGMMAASRIELHGSADGLNR